MLVRGISALIVLFLLTFPRFSSAQDDASAKEKSPMAGAGAAKFNELFEQWKGIIKDLRTLKSDYTKAKPDEAKGLDAKWKELIAQGNDLLPQLRAEGLKVYSESAAVDPQVQRFLIKAAQDALKMDDDEPAYEVATQMLQRSERDKAPAPKELYGIAAAAAFFTNEYDACEKYLEQAKSVGAWNEKDYNESNIQIESSLEKYKELWATEKELREQEAKANDLPRVKLTTSAGEIVVELFENEAPDTVGNFVSLVEAKFYDGLKFHRVLPHFMAQGGDPKGNGSGGPGYNIYDEVDKPNYRRHFRGSLSMAKTEFPDTGGSQFFLCFTQQPNLDGKHTVFGRVLEGMDVLAKIQRIDPEKPSDDEPTVIEKAEVLRKREHQYLPRKVE
jgi:cyclophilin family peptidyl-prolyl cis-trans isomerase